MLFFIWSGLSLLLTGVYAAVIFAYRRGWRGLPVCDMPPDFRPSTKVTVVVPARNEASNIGACLRSILAGSYPPELLEIIVVDDFSDDETAAIVRHFQRKNKIVRLLSLADSLPPGVAFNSHKKIALEMAVGQASGALIVTTDADCLAPPDWLRRVAAVFESAGTLPSPAGVGPGGGVKILAAPVVFHREKNGLQRFQALDFLGLMGITGAGIRLGWQRLGNGANLAYPKTVFEEVGGYEGVGARASGDDLFLLQKVARRWPGGVFFLKNAAAAVRTEAPADWPAFFRQRLRWGTKNVALPEPGPKIVLLVVFVFCWTIVLNAMVVWPLGRIPGWIPAVQIVVKAVCDLVFLREMCAFFGRRDLLKSFVPAFFLHIFYIAAVGTASLFVKKYNWKGRRVR